MDQITKLNKEISKLKNSSKRAGIRYPERVKKMARELMSSGTTKSSLSRATGISAMALANWHREEENHFMPVEVLPVTKRSENWEQAQLNKIKEIVSF